MSPLKDYTMLLATWLKLLIILNPDWIISAGFFMTFLRNDSLSGLDVGLSGVVKLYYGSLLLEDILFELDWQNYLKFFFIEVPMNVEQSAFVYILEDFTRRSSIFGEDAL